jgi:hypothetical protein
MIKLGPLFSASVSTGLPIALWQLPGAHKIQTMIELSDTVSATRITLKMDDRGFAVSPFINPEGKETLFLRGDLSFETTADELVEGSELAGNPEKQEREKALIQRMNQLKSSTREKTLCGTTAPLHLRPNPKNKAIVNW